MDKIGKYEVTAFTKARQDITIVSQEGKRKLAIHALLEIDVTKARGMIVALKEKQDISLLMKLLSPYIEFQITIKSFIFWYHSFKPGITRRAGLFKLRIL